MIARLIRTDGTVEREWWTSRPNLALTADRNYPAGWRVEIAGMTAESALTNVQPEVGVGLPLVNLSDGPARKASVMKVSK